ncbi:MAG: EamA family transporter [Acidobacteria bacterium]|nr:MAG: EamA family transporter [Acidobacteriota bacterium]
MTQRPSVESKTSQLRATAALASAGALWGTAFLFGKIAFCEMSVSTNVALRFCFGSLVLLPVVFFRRPQRFSRRDFWNIVVAGVIGVPVQFLIQFKGLALTTVSHASLMVSSLPLLLAFSAVLFLGEKLRFFEWGVLTLSTAGAVLISISKTSSGPQPSMKGDLLVVLSMVAAVVLTLITKRLVEIYDPAYVTASTILAGTVFLVAWTAILERPRLVFSARAWLAVAAQGVLATAMAYLLWNWGMVRLPAAKASIFFNMEPLVGTILGLIVLHERLSGLALLGGTMIVCGAMYFSTRTHASAEE